MGVHQYQLKKKIRKLQKHISTEDAWKYEYNKLECLIKRNLLVLKVVLKVHVYKHS